VRLCLQAPGLAYSKIFWKRDALAYLFDIAINRVKVKRLSKEHSADFLNKGFCFCGVKPPEKLGRVIETMDGIVGWLAHYGNHKLKGLNTW
jgi:hypothetical protein